MNWGFQKEHYIEKSNNMTFSFNVSMRQFSMNQSLNTYNIMKKTLLLLPVLLLTNCKYYNFTGTGKIDAETVQVNFFQNYAELVEPGLDRDFTIALQDLIQNQTSLNLISNNGDLVYEGEIVDFRIAPMTATANQQAAQNRVTLTVNVRFMNKKKEEDNFEKRFSFFYDYPAEQQLIGSTLNAGKEAMFERILQDIFNESLAKW
jgi:hypothetical protein